MVRQAGQRLTLSLFSLFLTLSGASALVYQVVWVRLLGLSIGATASSIAIVIAAFFLGLGAGSFFTGSFIRSARNPLQLYLLLEAFIALSALGLLPILLHLDHIVSLLPWLGSSTVFRFITAFLLLAIPTFFIGLTYPLLSDLCTTQSAKQTATLAHLYAFNTLGALVGMILAGFVLIPRFGLDGSIYIAATGNLLIVLLGVLFYKRFEIRFHKITTKKSPRFGKNRKAFFLLFAGGFVSIATEVGWMKYLIIYTGNTIYGYSIILAIFLAGIALGAWAAKSRFLQRFPTDKLILTTLLLLGTALLFARSGLALFPQLYEMLNTLAFDPFLSRWSKYGAMFILLFPATFLFGLLFPLALNYYSPGARDVGRDVGHGYAVNIVAGIFGSLAAGFWLIPQYGTDSLLLVGSFLILLTALFFIPSLDPGKLHIVAGSWVIVLLLTSTKLPSLDLSSMVSIVMARENPHTPGYTPPATPLFQKEGKAGVISIYTRHGNPCTLKLLNNGAPESWFDICDPHNVAISEYLLGTLPHLLYPEANDAFVLGYGGGVTVRALSASSLKSIDVIELEPAVVDGVRHVYGGEIPTDKDPRIKVRFDDARHTLLRSLKTYDLIVSQPSHPWLSGGANIMSRDFFKIVASRLRTQGIYGQWVNLFRIDTDTLKSIFRAFTDVFPYTISFVNPDTMDFLLFGSKSKIELDLSTIQNAMGHPDIQKVFRRHGVISSKEILQYFALSDRQLRAVSQKSRPTTDTNLLTETFYSTYRQNENNSFDTLNFIQSYRQYDVIPYLSAFLHYGSIRLASAPGTVLW